jgi:hypothetical protein
MYSNACAQVVHPDARKEIAIGLTRAITEPSTLFSDPTKGTRLWCQALAVVVELISPPAVHSPSGDGSHVRASSMGGGAMAGPPIVPGVGSVSLGSIGAAAASDQVSVNAEAMVVSAHHVCLLVLNNRLVCI